MEKMKVDELEVNHKFEMPKQKRAFNDKINAKNISISVMKENFTKELDGMHKLMNGLLDKTMMSKKISNSHKKVVNAVLWQLNILSNSEMPSVC